MADKTAKKIMEFVKTQIGVKESPPDSNKVKYNTWFYGREVSGSQYPWCCAFVCYCFNKNDMADLFFDGKKTASCANFEDWAKLNKLTVPVDEGKYGDIVLFHFGGGRTRHIGFIVSKNSDGSYKTIEGNTSMTSDDNGGMVMERTRKQNLISSIVRPNYINFPLVTINENCNRFEEKYINSKKYRVDKDSKLQFIKDCNDGWSKVSVREKDFYVKNKFIDKKGLSNYIVKEVSQQGNLRKSENSDSEIILNKVQPGTKVKIISKRDGWSNVIIDGKSGWFRTNKIKF